MGLPSDTSRVEALPHRHPLSRTTLPLPETPRPLQACQGTHPGHWPPAAHPPPAGRTPPCLASPPLLELALAAPGHQGRAGTGRQGRGWPGLRRGWPRGWGRSPPGRGSCWPGFLTLSFCANRFQVYAAGASSLQADSYSKMVFPTSNSKMLRASQQVVEIVDRRNDIHFIAGTADTPDGQASGQWC
ncbi:uncharacterized protein [Miscanthus floridulus]|uniref:uncharacterized protein n=1 Tax=Miscanthus floridulus TaxID=154761 RepID=UPI00345A666F